MTPPTPQTAILLAGIPNTNKSLYHAIRFNVGDPAALIITLGRPRFSGGGEPPAAADQAHRLLILRDIEMDRAKKQAAADQIACPKDFAPGSSGGGLSGDRETATAQAAAQAILRAGCTNVIADRTLPLSFIDELRKQNIAVEYDPDLGVTNRRAKTEEEIAYLRQAQHATERAIEMACTMIARATPNKEGILHHGEDELTAEAVRLAIDIFLLTHGYANPRSIVAPGRQGSDCHAIGTGPIRTGQPVIIDIFPQNKLTKYNGDCTRTVVHGDIPDEVKKMHAVVLQAKKVAEQATRPGVTGEDVHRETIQVIGQNGYAMGFPTHEHPITMPHGTGHGIGLDVHEPPLLDLKAPELIVGDALTIEPGLYSQQYGGVRVEDMVIVTEGGCENLNILQQGLNWS